VSDKLIIFSHHYFNDEIIDRFNNLKKLNPTWDIVSIGFEGYNLLKDSIYIKKDIYPSNKDIQYYVPNNSLDWFECDLFLYDGYRQCPNYDAYFLYEYDTICNVNIDNFFNTNIDSFGNNIKTPAEETWEWIKLYRKHNNFQSHFKQLYSFGQSTCIYVNNDILKKCADEIIINKNLYNNMFCEVRGGTLINQFTTLKKGRDNISRYISWTNNDITLDKTIPYFYHPVK